MKFEYPEGATPIDAAAALDLRQSYITTQAQLNVAEQRNILEAQLWSRTTTHKNILDEAFLKRVHKQMFGQVWKWAGKFKTRDHENERFARYWEVAIKLRELLENTKHQTTSLTRDDEESWDEVAVRFHHQLVLIHAFPNGNGRHAREVADLLLLHNGQAAFTWGRTIVDARLRRSQYIAAQKAADEGKLQPLLEFARV